VAAARELREEAGVDPVGSPIAVAMLFDARVGTWDIVHRVEVAGVVVGDPASWEHEEVIEEPDPTAREPASHATTLLRPLTQSR
jgi:8-oxo-dGTP pyrophosphatase MutT (NUDIX family)